MTIIRYNKFEQPELLKQAQTRIPSTSNQECLARFLQSRDAKRVVCHQALKIYVIRSLHSQMDPNGGFKSQHPICLFDVFGPVGKVKSWPGHFHRLEAAKPKHLFINLRIIREKKHKKHDETCKLGASHLLWHLRFVFVFPHLSMPSIWKVDSSWTPRCRTSLAHRRPPGMQQLR